MPRTRKITDEQVRQIRDLDAAGVRGTAIAARFGVSPSYVHNIVTGVARRTAPGPTRRVGRRGVSTLTPEQVAGIRQALHVVGWGAGKILAERFGVSEGQISRIRSGSNWPAWRADA